MSVIPVIDVRGGLVVRGIAGDREHYRPLVSQLVDSCDPLTVALALRPYCTNGRIYLADLDGIMSADPHWELYQQLVAHGLRPLIDAGISEPTAALRLLELPGAMLVAGLESLADPRALQALARQIPHQRLVFSLDLQGGRPLTSASRGDADWPTDPCDIVDIVGEVGISTIIVLDLGDVGTSSGGSTLQLCAKLRKQHPELSLIVGGGVRGPSDLIRWQRLGVDGVLVASALHDGRVTLADVRQSRCAASHAETP